MMGGITSSMVWMWLNCVIPGLSLPFLPLPKMLMISKSLRRLLAKRNLMSAPNRYEVFLDGRQVPNGVDVAKLCDTWTLTPLISTP